jgi:hypothetical protein
VLNSGGERYRTTITLIIVVDVKLVMLGSTWHLAVVGIEYMHPYKNDKSELLLIIIWKMKK